MDQDAALEKLEQSLERELKAVSEFQLAETRVKTALAQRDWNQLEQSIQQVQDWASRMEAADLERQAAWDELNARRVSQGEEADFYAFAAGLPGPRRERLTDLRRKLKVAVVGAKGTTSGLEEYVNITSQLIQGVLQEARPSLKGRLYSPRGQIRPSGTASLVLDRQF